MPTGLAGVLNEVGPEEHKRDSAYYSSLDPSSKHNSQLSSSDVVMAPSPTGYHSSSADISPSPAANHIASQQLTSPTSGSMSVASMVSPSYEDSVASQLASMSGQTNRQSYGSGLGALSMNGDSRRESVDSRLGTGFQDLRLNSPYASNNQSTTSIQSTLQQQRNPGNTADRLSNPRFSNSYQPQRLPEPTSPRSTMPKTAPMITGPAMSNIARAAEPTKGEAWAFPEEPVHRVRNSHDRHLEDNQSMSRNRQISDLQAEDGDSPNSGQPYSRTPELRVSHKLAERKRRTEMKELFENLRDLMPQERGNKASKWEILTKAIAEHNAQAKEIQELKARLHNSQIEMDNLRREGNVIRLENSQLRSDLSQAGSNNHPSVMNGFTSMPQNGGSHVDMNAYQPESYAPRGSYQRNEQLPPLRMSQPESMSGVQYQSDMNRNGYRDPRF
ncbi:hypothetical protein SS1G_01995 [Sclerotinia sclerotiorum 1980 UF-70]|uniref:BHLH domain-containing protein n=1 Tax=Sclerotinia sclerotiorum (strain ATCC 18683 / 1980 / Ss-1) TaxID=665079 RepID=A7E9L5_SCLS1|nr:hypothetical protein SS1G_01995 [Sclerotinia sclerotiorum 1980 UF-70]EDN97067.1 hypothetical protein SS1G_01995 [Sclerotinia sclerotiorum 1980 UF-70]